MKESSFGPDFVVGSFDVNLAFGNLIKLLEEKGIISAEEITEIDKKSTTNILPVGDVTREAILLSQNRREPEDIWAKKEVTKNMANQGHL